MAFSRLCPSIPTLYVHADSNVSLASYSLRRQVVRWPRHPIGAMLGSANETSASNRLQQTWEDYNA